MRLSGRMPVKSPTRITPANNGKIRPQLDGENAFARASGGEDGIRPAGFVRRPRYARPQGDHLASTTEEGRGCRPRASNGRLGLDGWGDAGPVFDLKEKRCQPLRASRSSARARDRSRKAGTTGSVHESPSRHGRMRQFRIYGLASATFAAGAGAAGALAATKAE